ncbi:MULTISPECIES: hypothetical protein [unclassified Tatumella]|uniref:hypothetical protein n=1 Tax=unclassified Tatumella TaxID=2649542 RepID=UPI001BAF3136|nr:MULTISPECIES: hypothetical protein [unclassified Tatumella]MBS0876521.1 hypothetical protein [Tatumella sp. JGM82]MBS0889694.1 hypothetical protein [Tatumella sp. JGM94]MBS0900816.1 hypothetical protein [Tatumella sp. JGM100]
MNFKYEITTENNNTYVIKNDCFYISNYYRYYQYYQSFLTRPTQDIPSLFKSEPIKHFIIYIENTFHATINQISYSITLPDFKMSNDYFCFEKNIENNQITRFFDQLSEEDDFNLLVSSKGEYYAKALKLRKIFSDVTQRMRNYNFNYYNLKELEGKIENAIK